MLFTGMRLASVYLIEDVRFVAMELQVLMISMNSVQAKDQTVF